MYRIDYDQKTRIMHLTCEGFWSLATLASFSAATMARGTTIRLRHGQFAVLNDSRTMPTQSAEVARGIELLMARSMSITTAPFATVASSMLTKLQGERVLKAAHTRVFLDYDEACAWLDAEWTQRRAA